MISLAGKVAVITGASRGLGKAMADIFARAGAKVVLAARSRAVMEHNAEELKRNGYEAAIFVCDVTNPAQVEALARYAIDTYGHFDIWINNAGVAGPYGSTFDQNEIQFLNVLQTNMLGVYYGSRIAMRHFMPRGSGKLVNILGRGARQPAPNQNCYGSSKAWARVFTLALAKEYKKSGVGVYALQPGLMETDLLTELVTFKEHEKSLRTLMPMLIRAGGRKPEVAARKALWLVSSATDGRTGLDVSVGSPFAFLAGFLREAVSRLLHLPVRLLDMNINIIPSAFEPLEGEISSRDKK
jgi:glucose 1-dehydrogenase